MSLWIVIDVINFHLEQNVAVLALAPSTSDALGCFLGRLGNLQQRGMVWEAKKHECLAMSVRRATAHASLEASFEGEPIILSPAQPKQPRNYVLKLFGLSLPNFDGGAASLTK